MLITHFGHACVLVEIDGVRVLIDPGAYSDGYESLVDLDAVLITHEHADHLDPARFPTLMANNPDARIITTAGVAAKLESPRVTSVSSGDTIQIGTLTVEATGDEHAIIHPLVPNVSNSGFVLGGDKLWHPGDSFDAAPRKVDVLLVPVGGPWMRLQEAIDFERAVAPRVSIPIHEAGLSNLHQSLHFQLLTNLAPEGTTFTRLERGDPSEI